MQPLSSSADPGAAAVARAAASWATSNSGGASGVPINTLGEYAVTTADARPACADVCDLPIATAYRAS
jgi:hypothetical protein